MIFTTLHYEYNQTMYSDIVMVYFHVLMYHLMELHYY